MYAMMQWKTKSENLAHILGYQIWAVTVGVASHELPRAPAMVAMVEFFFEILCGSSSCVPVSNEEGKGEGMG